eukprot:snap_masked-scaffold_14-processed-gene-11.15-mRNA-1 protein AED:1.00 eAED:1.00 QI:0/-1/0/0/-1/1/1/0/337
MNDVFPSSPVSPERRALQVHKNSTGKFFVYQPSGGWGNQILILLNAIAAANFMERTLVVPPIAPHNFLYTGYNRFKAEEMAPMDKIIDIDLLESAVDNGVLFWNKTLKELKEFWKEKSWKKYSKPRYNPADTSKHKKIWTWNKGHIRRDWLSVDQEVVFWNKDGMFLCCGPYNEYNSYIGFNQEFRKTAYMISKYISKQTEFNAVHIRKGQGHINKDRRTALEYFISHDIHRFNRTQTLYIATDTPKEELDWFIPFTEDFHFENILFWDDIIKESYVKKLIKGLTTRYHQKMKRDIEGFIEQLICTYAKEFEGSKASTFSIAIKKFRAYPRLHKIWV